ncbi:MAG: glycosyl hydrolase [Lactobacillus sp.]|jgi:hypothetical protein|nr:glycosyl hydrolase [Lactobacillus sp.]
MNETEINIDGSQLKTDSQDANTFKGFGYISCNNSSRLLLDYKAKHPAVYQQILTILFGGKHPLLRLLKVELGDDANTSSGTEPATKRSQSEPANVCRGAGYQLIADAKKIQPQLKTGLLRWGEPGWLKDQWRQVKSTDPDHLVPESAFEAMYQWYKETIIAAYETYGYLIDYVDPDRNETKHPMFGFIKWFAKRLQTDTTDFPTDFPIAAYHQIKLIAADQNYETNFGTGMLADAELRQLVPAVGYHYNTDDGPDQAYTQLADKYHHEVWYSEGVAPMTSGKYRIRASAKTGIGGTQSGLDVANRVVKSYYKSRRSLYLFQPAVAAYYPGVNYSHKELITAQHPWSGYFEVDNAGLQIIKHFTNFAKSGWATESAWRYLTPACYSGVLGTENLSQNTQAASYMTLMSPDKADFSTILVNDSPEPRTYTLHVTNTKAATKPVYCWTSTGPNKDQAAYDANLMQLSAISAVVSGQVSFTVAPYMIATLTTLDRRQDSEVAYHEILSAAENQVLTQDNQVLYADDFNYSPAFLKARGNTPLYTTDQGGAFEVTQTPTGPVLQQMITEQERALDWEYSFAPNFTLGDDRWCDYNVALTFKFDHTTQQNSQDGNYLGIGLREQTDVKGRLTSAPYVFKLDTNGYYELIVRQQVVTFGYVDLLDVTIAHQLQFAALGNTLSAKLDGQSLVTWQDTDNPTYSGRVKVGCGYYHTQIQNLTITPATHGQISTQRVDDLAANIHYSGDWDHQVGLGNTLWQRTLSIGTAGPDTAVQFEFDGSGFNLIGHQVHTSQLDVFVDGQIWQAALTPNSGADKASHLQVANLPAGHHQITLKVVAGTYYLDAIEYLK